MYSFLPGGQLYVEAANGYLQDRFLFGTAYPALPFQGTVERVCGLSFSDEVLDKVLFGNAARLLGTEPHNSARITGETRTMGQEIEISQLIRQLYQVLGSAAHRDNPWPDRVTGGLQYDICAYSLGRRRLCG